MLILMFVRVLLCTHYLERSIKMWGNAMTKDEISKLAKQSLVERWIPFSKAKTSKRISNIRGNHSCLFCMEFYDTKYGDTKY
jgi:hypothetical protein